MKILNVTPEEFNEISIRAVDLSAADFESFMRMYYGCERYTSYRVVVRRDVRYIPMMSQNVNRIEEAR